VTGWFVDENDLLLGRRLGEQHSGVFYPGHADLPEVPRGTADDEWLQVVETRRLVVITRDKRIRYRPVERQRWIEHRVRGFVLTGAGNLRLAEQLQLLATHWNAMERFVGANAEGPWMCSLTRAGVRNLIAPL
jgi:hypothetical protein